MEIKKLFGRSEYRTHWQWYKDLFNITIFRYLVFWFSIVPIIASFKDKFPEEIEIFKIINIDLSFLKTLPFNWEILWFSSLFYVIALLIYQVRCPKFTKNYSSFGEYKNIDHSHRWLIWLAQDVIEDKKELDSFFKRLNKKMYLEKGKMSFENSEKTKVEVEEKVTSIYFKHKDEIYKFSLPKYDKKGQIIENDVREIFWEIFAIYSSSREKSRMIIVLLLILSCIGFSTVLLQHIISMLIYFLNICT